MKLGIIGVGAVGSAIAMAAASRARVREIVLVNRNRARAKAVATDMHYGAALSPIVMIRDGDYAEVAFDLQTSSTSIMLVASVRGRYTLPYRKIAVKLPAGEGRQISLRCDDVALVLAT